MTQLVDVSARGMLNAWERALFAKPAVRPLILLEAATREDRSALGALPLGARDHLLLELRRTALGARIECEANCPACGERVEFEVSAPALVSSAGESCGDSLEIEHGDWRVCFRLPTAADLVGCADLGREGARSIVRGCVLRAWRSDTVIEAQSLPDALLEAVAKRCAELDPQADIELDLACPACGHDWRTPFDIAAFLWAELDSWATQMLDEIHVIASRYGWSEAQILDLSPSRRHYYLDRLRG